MIEALKSDHIVEKLGGRFKLTALIQRRLGEPARSSIETADLTLKSSSTRSCKTRSRSRSIPSTSRR
jgi:hypothetical protein